MSGNQITKRITNLEELNKIYVEEKMLTWMLTSSMIKKKQSLLTAKQLKNFNEVLAHIYFFSLRFSSPVFRKIRGFGGEFSAGRRRGMNIESIWEASGSR